MRIVSVIGARPQFVKAAAICRAAATRPAIVHRIVHTGQHYDPGMSDVFFQELGIPAPDYNLGIGSASHAVQTAGIMQALEPALEAERPDWVLLYGDTNSTLAGATVAAKLCLPAAHVEAGLRSFNRRMPEEINRIVADHLSQLLLAPTTTAMENLEREGLAPRAVLTGDVMYDITLELRKQAARRPLPPSAAGLKRFALATVHRAENTDDSARLAAIMEGLERVAREICPVFFPVHPRTTKRLASIGFEPRHVIVAPPAGYLEMAALESRAAFILTDSGGVQKEAYFLEVPCITLRDETEWVETLAHNCNILVGADAARMVAAARDVRSAGPWTAAYGTGHAAGIILEALCGTSALTGPCTSATSSPASTSVDWKHAPAC
jgi:UDP-GlcNAc3NAcA epimerase